MVIPVAGRGTRLLPAEKHLGPNVRWLPAVHRSDCRIGTFVGFRSRRHTWIALLFLTIYRLFPCPVVEMFLNPVVSDLSLGEQGMQTFPEWRRQEMDRRSPTAGKQLRQELRNR